MSDTAGVLVCEQGGSKVVGDFENWTSNLSRFENNPLALDSKYFCE